MNETSSWQLMDCVRPAQCSCANFLCLHLCEHLNFLSLFGTQPALWKSADVEQRRTRVWVCRVQLPCSCRAAVIILRAGNCIQDPNPVYRRPCFTKMNVNIWPAMNLMHRGSFVWFEQSQAGSPNPITCWGVPAAAPCLSPARVVTWSLQQVQMVFHTFRCWGCSDVASFRVGFCDAGWFVILQFETNNLNSYHSEREVVLGHLGCPCQPVNLSCLKPVFRVLHSFLRFWPRAQWIFCFLQSCYTPYPFTKFHNTHRVQSFEFLTRGVAALSFVYSSAFSLYI